MTNQEAIKWLREAEILDLTCGDTKDRQAVDMAIAALQAQANESKTRNFLFTESGNESKERDLIS